MKLITNLLMDIQYRKMLSVSPVTEKEEETEV